MRQYDGLLTLRAYACLLVLIGHGTLIAFRPFSLKSQDNAFLFTSCPWAGVWIFFVLSGFLMGKVFYCERYNLSLKGIKNFYFNRALRIIPLYWFAVLLVSIVVHPEIFAKHNYYMLIRHLTFNYQPNLRIIPISALWSVSTEVKFYLIVPLVFLIARKCRFHLTALLACLAAGLIFRIYLFEHYQFGGWLQHVYMPLYANLDLFLAGFLLNPIISKLKNLNFSINYGELWCVCLMLIFYTLSSFAGYKAMVLGSTIYRKFLLSVFPSFTAILTVICIALFELTATYNGKYSVVKYTQFAGILTYPVYVWHEPIFLAISKYVPKNLSMNTSLLYFLLALSVTFIAAIASFYLLEKPLLKIKRFL